MLGCDGSGMTDPICGVLACRPPRRRGTRGRAAGRPHRTGQASRRQLTLRRRAPAAYHHGPRPDTSCSAAIQVAVALTMTTQCPSYRLAALASCTTLSEAEFARYEEIRLQQRQLLTETPPACPVGGAEPVDDRR
jgi:hypothetical protein